MSDYWFLKYVEMSGSGLIWGTVPGFAWKDKRKMFSLGNLSTSWDLDPEPPEYEAGVPPKHIAMFDVRSTHAST
jgi:hypothetical protein